MRHSSSLSYFGDTIPLSMRIEDFFGVLGSQIGTDSLADPITRTRSSIPLQADPIRIILDKYYGIYFLATISLRDALIQQFRSSSKHYPAPNLNIPDGTLPNCFFTANNSTAADQTGIRVDHRFKNNNLLFGPI
jgi:hypothetical protein